MLWLAALNRAVVFFGVAASWSRCCCAGSARSPCRVRAQQDELAELESLRAALTPSRGPGPRRTCSIATSFTPADGLVAGDFFLVVDGPAGSTTVVVGDVVGHGLEAARCAAFVRAALRHLRPLHQRPRPAAPARQRRPRRARRRTDAQFVTAVCLNIGPPPAQHGPVGRRRARRPVVPGHRRRRCRAAGWARRSASGRDAAHDRGRARVADAGRRASWSSPTAWSRGARRGATGPAAGTVRRGAGASDRPGAAGARRSRRCSRRWSPRSPTFAGRPAGRRPLPRRRPGGARGLTRRATGVAQRSAGRNAPKTGARCNGSWPLRTTTSTGWYPVARAADVGTTPVPVGAGGPGVRRRPAAAGR